MQTWKTRQCQSKRKYILKKMEPWLHPKSPFIPSFQSNAQRSTVHWPFCKRTQAAAFAELWIAQISNCGFHKSLHFDCINLKSHLSRQLWWPEFDGFCKNLTIAFSGSIGHESPPLLPTSIFLQPQNVPKRPWEDALNCPGPVLHLAQLPYYWPPWAVRANPCYSDDALSPAIVLLLWCYTPISVVSKCYSSCAMATTPFVLSPTVLTCSCTRRAANSRGCRNRAYSGLPVWMSSDTPNLWS